MNHAPQRLFDQTEAGCRILINLLLLRVASTMSDENTDVNIIPEYPIAKIILAENRSFGGVVDFLMAKLPARYTGKSRAQSCACVRKYLYPVLRSPASQPCDLTQQSGLNPNHV